MFSSTLFWVTFACIALMTEAEWWCDRVTVANGRVVCTTKQKSRRYINMTTCLIHCNRQYERHGPEGVDCYRGLWYISGGGHLLYEDSTKCKRSFAGDGRSLGFNSPVERHDGMCSRTPCGRRYYGITESRCESYNCCWNNRERDCYEYLETRCQIAIAKRATCPGTWYGIPKHKCEAKDCCYDAGKSRCYMSKPDDFGQPEPGKSLSGGEKFCRRIPKMLRTFIDCTNGEHVGSKCTAYCATGYAVRTPSKSATCLSTGKWSSSTVWRCEATSGGPDTDPSEEAKFCGGLANSLVNGDVACKESGGVLICEAECHDRFVLEGDSVRRCHIQGKEKLPGSWRCRREYCPEIRSSPRTFVDCTNGEHIGSTCTATCARGYALHAARNTATCLSTGEWSALTAWQCVEVQCPAINPEDIVVGISAQNANRATISCTNHRNFASVCAVNCPLGYMSTGPTNIQCQVDGEWSRGVFRCSPLQCAVPHVQSYVSLVCSDGYNVGSECSAFCKKGYELVGAPVTTCRGNQRWSASLALTSCEVVRECEDLVIPAGAELYCTHGFKVDTLCSLTCPPGELLQGLSAQVVVCLEDLTWDQSFQEESCKGPPKCGALQTVFPHAPWDKLTTVCSGDDNNGSVCTIDCGDNGEGSVVTVCTSNGGDDVRWDTPPPTKCVDLATQECNFEIDLATGEHSGIGDYSDHISIEIDPSLPIWKRFRNSRGRAQCDYQSMVKLNSSKLSGFALKIEYEVPSSLHFELSDSTEPARGAMTMRGENFNIKGVPGFAGKRVFPSKDEIMFTLKKSSPEIAYVAGSADERAIPIDFSGRTSLYIGLNRAVHVQHGFDMRRMGSGMCKFCLSYATLE